MQWDVIVIGGGHAGCEAAHASARMGCRTALFSLDPSRIALMSCNPAMGGLAKGQLIKEIDALGGVMGRNTDRTAIQFRRLNSSKGPAVRSSRAQCDKALYAAEMQRFLSRTTGLNVISGEVVQLLYSGGRIRGVRTATGEEHLAHSVVITSGTFLRALMYTGFSKSEGGRVGEQAARGLSESLEGLGFKLSRLKTGTPPRLNRRSIDFSRTQEQPGDERPIPFSFYTRTDPFPLLPQVSCYITYTNEQTHELIEANFDKSPMFTGLIKGMGPRYCPSIEDKVKRFRDKGRHQIFLEPEGLGTDDIYVNGISTSLPADVQEKFVRSIVGLEKAEFVRFGYAVEYDSIDATALRATLESKDVAGLFFAGQINGTSGYEEAGAQGLIAGINAALSVKGREAFVLSRLDGYIGVMIDDLVTKGTDEPYRMFTSRAEYRLILREDNADLRLGELGHKVGLLGEPEYRILCEKREGISKWREALAGHFFMPTTEMNGRLTEKGLSTLKDRVSAEVLLRRPEVQWSSLCELGFPGQGVGESIQEQLEIQVKYEGYIRRDLDLLEGMRKSENLRIPVGFDFDTVPGLSNEIKGRLKRMRPETIGQASRLSGVTPAAVANLMIFLKMIGRRA
ncbi:MAG: tRNA uridine-5-carboxymethylaminomethyl(34) synthesis enzyme MnmG [Oligoflexia bacterium]|nr:tRNA uridine-5-carboxymethylaminomethyl(34) synthesis enzyme MnmG [Oligoflexia bacterium]